MGGGDSWLNFAKGCAIHSFQMVLLALPILVEMIPLARLNKVPQVGFF